LNPPTAELKEDNQRDLKHGNSFHIQGEVKERGRRKNNVLKKAPPGGEKRRQDRPKEQKKFWSGHRTREKIVRPET